MGDILTRLQYLLEIRMKIKCKSGVDAELCTEAAVAEVEVEEVAVCFPPALTQARNGGGLRPGRNL